MEYTIEVINIRHNSSCNLPYGDRPTIHLTITVSYWVRKNKVKFIQFLSKCNDLEIN